MVNILAISPEPARANEIGRALAAGDSRYRFHTSETSLADLCIQHDALDDIDLLLVDGVQMTAQDFTTLASLTSQHASLVCVMLTPDPSAEVALRAMRAGVRDVRPWPAPHEDLLRAIDEIASRIQGARRAGKVISFVSCKGGSGTSFLAANLGFAASAAGKHALLIDLSQQYGEAAFLVTESTPPATIADVCMQIDRLDQGYLEACLTHVADGFDVLAGAPDPARAKEIKPEHLQRIVSLVRHRYDLVIFDVGQSISNVSIAALDLSESIFPVVQLSLPYLRGARRLLEMFRSLGYGSDRIHLVVNRFHKKGPLGLAELEKTLGQRVETVIPEDSASVSESINQGVPILRLARTSGVAKGLWEMAHCILPAPEANGGSFLQKLFRKPIPARA
ncbi:AAA family ATPase [Paraburkholderia hospita]|jgi:pilus assembly protein CpaE|uniref:Pilus assembly protein n=1 Tax=Paraburkholderia hospita TaxID=169430 RepID=A0AAN1J817_9BURK|nr:AAA family ATPase [Paraburkholderia hospita]AUT69230.1 pilus assembly protein [Paraburkholderia hospita]SEI16543.1 pilus assembly protein CpaE [Paraburkholderia hospita]